MYLFFRGNSKVAVITECKKAEQTVHQEYEEVLKHSTITDFTRSILEGHRDEIAEGLSKSFSLWNPLFLVLLNSVIISLIGLLKNGNLRNLHLKLNWWNLYLHTESPSLSAGPENTISLWMVAGSATMVVDCFAGEKEAQDHLNRSIPWKVRLP